MVTCDRLKIFTEDNVVNVLRQAFRTVLVIHPFKIEAAVILPEHLHMIWRLPECDADYPTRWRLIKSFFTSHWAGAGDMPIPGSRQIKGERAVWQRRYWEHVIRDGEDLKRHVEYIHYNPVKHGWVRAPKEWQYSSFHTFVKEGLYSPDWGSGVGFEVSPVVGME